jgi:hypothetical protein
MNSNDIEASSMLHTFTSYDQHKFVSKSQIVNIQPKTTHPSIKTDRILPCDSSRLNMKENIQG